MEDPTPAPESPRALRIGEAAARAGLTVKALRYYESLGLLDPPRRAANGYRRYGPEAVAQLELVRRAKLLGLSLEDIRRLVTPAKARAWAAVRAELVDVLDEKLAACDRRITELEELRRALRERRRRAAAARAEPPCACERFDAACTCLPDDRGAPAAPAEG